MTHKLTVEEQLESIANSLDFETPQHRETIFRAAGIEFTAGDSLEKYFAAKCELRRMIQKARIGHEVQKITGAITPEAGLEIVRRWANEAGLAPEGGSQ